SAIGQHEAVKEVVVVAQDAPGAENKRLVAYVVAEREAEEALETGSFRAYLQKKLPEYMIPSAFVMLEALPLTPNGKVDRRALPAPDQTRTNEASYVAPRTPVEHLLVEIWSKVLGLEQIGVNDNFFEIGGDSILSIQIISRANKAGLHLTPRQLFQHQTVARLAAVASSSETVIAEQGVISGAVRLTPIQNWFFERNLAEPHHFNQALLLEVAEPPDLELLKQTVNHLVQHHDALRLRFHHTAAGWQQVNSAIETREVFRCHDLSPLSDEELAAGIQAVCEAEQQSLNLSDGPLMRVAFLDLGVGRRGRLLLVVHHLAIDGVSLRILLEDLHSVYEQLSRGEKVILPLKTTSYQQWAAQLVQYAEQQDERAQEINYWTDERWQKAARLPVERAGARNTQADARNVSLSLSAEETGWLLHEVPQAYHTQIQEVLLTALALTLREWTKSPAVLVDVEGHGREEISETVDVSRTVGWFTTFYPLLLEVEANEGVGEALKSVKEQLRAIPHRGLGYGVFKYLSRNAAVREKLSNVPKAEVSFK